MPYVPVEITPEQLTAFETEHEDICVVRGTAKAPWVYVMKRPTRQQTIAYKQHAKRNLSTASEALLRHIVLAPTGEQLQKQIDRWPFGVDAAISSDSFQEFVGITIDEQVKE